VLIEVNEHHKKRKVPHPARVTLVEEQTVKFEDSRYLLSPYRVMTQETVYHYKREDIVDYTETAAVK